MSHTPGTHSNAFSRAVSRLFQRRSTHASSPTGTSSHGPRQIVPRVADAPGAARAVASAPSAVDTPPTPSTSVAPTPTARQRTYTVQQGDTLATIAERLYGDASCWPLLQEANRDRVSHPDRIYAGQVLMVPDAPLH